MPVFTKVVYEEGVTPFGLLPVRFAIAAVILLAAALLRGEALPRGRRLGALVLLGGVGYVTQSLCYFSALERISAGLTSLLLYAYPALVVVLSAVFLKVRPRPAAVACTAVAMAGTALTIGPVGGGQATGVLLGLGAAAAYSVYIVASSRATEGVGPFATSGVVMGAAAVVYGTLALAVRPPLPATGRAWAATLGVALVGTVLAATTFFAALSRLGPNDTAVLSTFEPVVSIVAAAVVLDERLGRWQVVGGAVVLAAVVVLSRLRRTETHVPLDAP